MIDYIQYRRGKPVPRERFHPFLGLSMTDLIDMEQGMSEFQVRGVDEIKAPMNFHGLDSRVDSKDWNSTLMDG